MTDNSGEITKKTLLIINDSPYGIERPYNALRLAMNLVKRPAVSLSVFMVGDGVLCVKKGQITPDGFYNIGKMISSLVRRGRAAT
jgi:uncharacterized protein involved in oxidation of intracellular sulfur